MTYEEAIAMRALTQVYRCVLQASIAFAAAVRTIACGAQKCAAHGLHRPTHERPGADSPSADPTQRWCSDWGKVRANVTGNSARTVGLHPSLALGLDCTEVATSWSRWPNGHPAEPMGLA